MPRVNHSVLIAATLISAVLISGCDSKSKNDKQSDQVSGVPGAEQPNVGDEIDNPPGSADKEAEKPGGEVYGVEAFAAELLSTPGVWRVQRATEVLFTPAKWEANYNTSLANADEMHLVGLNWKKETAGFLSVNPLGESAQVTECLGSRRVDTVDHHNLVEFLETKDNDLCRDRMTRIKKLGDRSFSLEQRCEAGDSVNLVFDRLSDSATFYNAALSYASDVLPNVDIREDVCGAAYADIVIEGEAWDLLEGNDWLFGSWSYINWYMPYEDGVLTASFSVFSDFTTGEYQVERSDNDTHPRISVKISYYANNAADDWDYTAQAGTVNVLQYDDKAVRLDFSVQREDGGFVEGRAGLSF